MSTIIEQLLHEEESSSLDFKMEQYAFSGASVEEKSELLKDILAFSNSWRRNEAYILLGVSEVKGGRSEIVGIDHHIDDAQIQQFVNSKINRPIEFSYNAQEIEGLQVAYIKIPVQNRPFYLKKDYGKLKKNVVYIRRGSSTGEASPDEVSEMGQSQTESRDKKPILSPFLVTGQHSEIFDTKMTAETEICEVPSSDELPDYPFISNRSENSLGTQILSMSSNIGYFRQFANYERVTRGVEGFSFAVRNDGNSVARDVILTFDVLGPREEFIIVRGRDLPSFPSKERHYVGSFLTGNRPPSDINVERISGGKRVRVELGKIQAKDMAVSYDSIFLGVTKTSDLHLNVKVYSDDTEAPTEENLTISFSVGHHKLTVEDIVSRN